MERHHGLLMLCTILALLALPLAHADACALRTHTQEEWGTSSRGDNPAAYRTRQFAAAFPDGLTIGVNGTASARFSASSKIQAFLPATGNPGVLTGDLVDPANTTGGALAGEAVAMALNIGFDAHNMSFAGASMRLSDATISSGACVGMTVGTLLSDANKRLAGMPAVRTAQQLSDCLAFVNGNASALSCESPTNTTASSNETAVPPNASEMNASNATTKATSFSLRVAPWYPKAKSDGTHYVFFCDAPIKPSRYDWRFGDGEKLLNITNGNVYHVFRRAGTFMVTCGNATGAGAMTVTVA